MSTVEVLTAGRSAPFGVGVGVGLLSSGFLGGAFAVVSLDIERCGMSLILLYRDCLKLAVSVCIKQQSHEPLVYSRWWRGRGAVFSLRDDHHTLEKAC